MPTPAPQDCAWSTGTNRLAHEVPSLDFSNTGPDTGSFFAVFTDFRIMSPVPATFGLGMSPRSFVDSGRLQVTGVPEPASDALPIAGLGLVGVLARAAIAGNALAVGTPEVDDTELLRQGE